MIMKYLSIPFIHSLTQNGYKKSPRKALRIKERKKTILNEFLDFGIAEKKKKELNTFECDERKQGDGYLSSSVNGTYFYLP